MGKIFFTKEEIEKVVDFANKIKWKHPHFADRENDTVRTEDHTFTSVVMGKLAEIAMHKYLKEKHNGKDFNISDLDFNIYKKGVCDDYDLKFNDYTISIKSSKPFASCLLIETEKYEVDNEGNAIGIDGDIDNIPDFYAFVKVDINYDQIEKSHASICGAISHKTFWDRKKTLPRGTYINKLNMDKFFKEDKPLEELTNDKGVKLLASNYGIHLDILKPF